MARLPSRSWSCSELHRGAAQVIDMQVSVDSLVVKQEAMLLKETNGLSAEQLQELLQDWLTLLRLWGSVRGDQQPN